MFKSLTKRSKLVLQLCASVSLVGISLGTVLGISATTFSIKYLDMSTLFSTSNKQTSYKEATPIESKWNNSILSAPTSNNNYINTKFTKETTLQNKYEYTCSILDGSNHTALDKSFNESVYNGTVNWINDKDIKQSDLGNPSSGPENNSAVVLKPSNDSISGFNDIYNVAANEFKVLSTPGFVHLNPILSLSNGHLQNGRTNFKNNKFIDTGFILTDGSIADNENVASVMFRADEAAFYTAISTCMYFMDNFDSYYTRGENISVGLFGGLDIPTVTAYMGGYQRGLQFFNTILLPKYYNNLTNEQKADRTIQEYFIQCIDLNDINAYFTGTFSIGDAKGITQQFLNRGADAIMGVAGPQTIDVAQEVQNQNSKCIVIGIDTDAENSDMQRKSKFYDSKGNNDIIKFSATKNMKYLTTEILKLAAEGKNWSGNSSNPPKNDKSIIYSFGYETVGNSFNNSVSISFAGWEYLLEGFSLLGDVFFNEWNDQALKLKSSIKFINGKLSEVTKTNYIEAFAIYVNTINNIQFNDLNSDQQENDGNIFKWLENNMYFIF